MCGGISARWSNREQVSDARAALRDTMYVVTLLKRQESILAPAQPATGRCQTGAANTGDSADFDAIGYVALACCL